MRNTQLNQFSAECNQTDKYIRMSLLEAEKILYFITTVSRLEPVRLSRKTLFRNSIAVNLTPI